MYKINPMNTKFVIPDFITVFKKYFTKRYKQNCLIHAMYQETLRDS